MENKIMFKSWRLSGRCAGRCRAAQLESIRKMSGQVSRGSDGEYQAEYVYVYSVFVYVRVYVFTIVIMCLSYCVYPKVYLLYYNVNLILWHRVSS